MKQQNSQIKQDSAIIVHDWADHEYRLNKEISRGGQGAVFRTDDHSIAVKLALGNDDTFLTNGQQDESFIKKENEKFMRLILLPIPPKTNITLPVITFRDAVGYSMKLMEDMDSFEKVMGEGEEYTNPWLDEVFAEDDSGLETLLKKYTGSGSARKRLHAYYLCACILAKLHARGLVYCDFSDKNVFITKDPLLYESNDSSAENNLVYSMLFMHSSLAENVEDSSVQDTPNQNLSTQKSRIINYLERDSYIFSDYEEDNVWLIDADNLNYQSVTRKGGYYTPKYGAPEVVSAKGCTFYSDCYAFAVSLFWDLTANHPLMGEAYENYEDEDDDFGEGADAAVENGSLPFVCDEEDNSNPAASPLIDMLIDEELMCAFRRTFSQRGKTEIRTRPSMLEWAQVIANALDTTIICPVCRMPYKGSSGVRCPWCDTVNLLINVTAYVLTEQETGVQTGSFRRELRDFSSVHVPMRIMTGVRPNSPKEMALQIAYENGKLIISSSTVDCTFTVMDSNTPIIGKYETTKERFSLRCRLKQQDEIYEMKIRIMR